MRQKDVNGSEKKVGRAMSTPVRARSLELRQKLSAITTALLAICLLCLALLGVSAAATPSSALALSHVNDGYNERLSINYQRTYDSGNVYISMFTGTSSNYTAAGQIKLTIWNNTSSDNDNYGYYDILENPHEFTVTAKTMSDDLKMRLGKTKSGVSSLTVTSRPVQPNGHYLGLMIPLTVQVPAHYCLTGAGNDGGISYTGGARLNFYSYGFAGKDWEYTTLRVLEHEEKPHWETIYVQVNLLRTPMMTHYCDKSGLGDKEADGTTLTKAGYYYRHRNACAWFTLGLGSESVRLILGTKKEYDAGKVYVSGGKWTATDTVKIGGVEYVYCEYSKRKCLATKTTTLPTNASYFHKADKLNADGSVTKYTFDGWKLLTRSKKVKNNFYVPEVASKAKTVVTSNGKRSGNSYTHCNQYGTTIKTIDTTTEDGQPTRRFTVTKNDAAVYYIANWTDVTKGDKYTVHYWFSPTKSMDIDLYTNVENDGLYETGYRYSISAYATAMAREMIATENKWLKYAATTYTCPCCNQTFSCPDPSYQKGAGDSDTRNDHWYAYLAHVNSLSPVDNSYTRYSCSYCGSDSTSSHTHYVCVASGSYLSCSDTSEDHTHTGSCYTDWEDWDYVNYCTAYTMYRYDCPDCGYSVESKSQSAAYNSVASHINAIPRTMESAGVVGAWEELTWDGTWWIGQENQPAFAEEWVNGTPLTEESTGYKNDLYLYANCEPWKHWTYPVTLIVNPGTDGENSWTEDARADTIYSPSAKILSEIESYYGIDGEDYGRLVGWWYDKECSEIPFVPIGIGEPTTIYAYTEHYVYYGLTTRGWSLEESSRALYEDKALTVNRKPLLDYNYGTNATTAFGSSYRRSELIRYGEVVEFDTKTTELWFKAAGKKRTTSNSEGYYDSSSPAAGEPPLKSVKIRGTVFVYRDWAGGIMDGVYARNRV